MTATSTALKEIFTAGRPLVEQWIGTARTMNEAFMAAWRDGVLDKAWQEFAATYPDLYLTYYLRVRGMGDIKIGKTRNLKTRFLIMMTYYSRGADLVACYPAPAHHEKELKDEFQHLRLCGEWFRAGPALLTHLQLIGVDTNSFTNELPSPYVRREILKFQ